MLATSSELSVYSSICPSLFYHLRHVNNSLAGRTCSKYCEWMPVQCTGVGTSTTYRCIDLYWLPCWWLSAFRCIVWCFYLYTLLLGDIHVLRRLLVTTISCYFLSRIFMSCELIWTRRLLHVLIFFRLCALWSVDSAVESFATTVSQQQAIHARWIIAVSVVAHQYSQPIAEWLPV